MAKIYQTATVLYDVLRTVVPSARIDHEVCFEYFVNFYEFYSCLWSYWPTWWLIVMLQIEKYAKEVERKRGQFVHFNILPLYAVGAKPAIMELPEVGLSEQHVRLLSLSNVYHDDSCFAPSYADQSCTSRNTKCWQPSNASDSFYKKQCGWKFIKTQRED